MRQQHTREFVVIDGECVEVIEVPTYEQEKAIKRAKFLTGLTVGLVGSFGYVIASFFNSDLPPSGNFVFFMWMMVATLWWVNRFKFSVELLGLAVVCVIASVAFLGSGLPQAICLGVVGVFCVVSFVFDLLKKKAGK